MKVLIACEFSGIVREAFKAKGHDAWSCDLLPTEIPGQHIQGNVLEHLEDGWDYDDCSSAMHISDTCRKQMVKGSTGKVIGCTCWVKAKACKKECHKIFYGIGNGQHIEKSY